MKKILGSIATLSVVLCACSSSSSGGSSPGSGTSGDGGGVTVDAGAACSGTASGGTTETLPCGLGAVFVNGTTEIEIVTPDQTIGVSVLINFNNAPTATTYSAATVNTELGVFKSADKTSEWQNQAGSGADSEGTFSLVITDVGPPTDLGSGAGTGYQQMHGTYTGSFVQVTPDGKGIEIDGGAPATLNVNF